MQRQHFLKERLPVFFVVGPTDVLDLLDSRPAVGGKVVDADVYAAKGIFQPKQTVFHAGGHLNDMGEIAGANFQFVQGLFQLFQLRTEFQGRVSQLVQHSVGIGGGITEDLNPFLYRFQQIGNIAQIIPQPVRAVVEHALAAREGLPGDLKLIQAAGGRVQPPLNLAERVQKAVQTAGEGPVIFFQIVLAFTELGDFLHLGQGCRNHQESHAAEGKILAACPDNKMLLLPRKDHKEYRPQIAHQLDLRAGGFQGENVVLIKQRRGRENVIVPGVITGGPVGQNVQQDFRHALLPRKLFRLGRYAVHRVPQADGPGQILKGRAGLAFKIEVVRSRPAKLEDRLAVPVLPRGVVRQIHHLVVNAVIRQCFRAVQGIALYHAALQEIAVIVQRGIVGFVVGRRHAVPNLLHSQSRGCEAH